MRVAVSSRNKEAAQNAAKALRHDADKLLAIQSDVRSAEDEAAAVKRITAHFGQLDVLVANAGVGHFAPNDTLNGRRLEKHH